jgi:hypothetical protein
MNELMNTDEARHVAAGSTPHDAKPIAGST